MPCSVWVFLNFGINWLNSKKSGRKSHLGIHFSSVKFLRTKKVEREVFQMPWEVKSCRADSHVGQITHGRVTLVQTGGLTTAEIILQPTADSHLASAKAPVHPNRSSDLCTWTVYCLTTFGQELPWVFSPPALTRCLYKTSAAGSCCRSVWNMIWAQKKASCILPAPLSGHSRWGIMFSKVNSRKMFKNII